MPSDAVLVVRVQRLVDRVEALTNVVLSLVAAVSTGYTNLNRRLDAMSEALTNLQAEVAQNADVIDSAIALLNGLSQQLKDALASSDPPAAIQALADQLDAKTNALAAAVATNTPAAPAPEGLADVTTG